jgi:hypothetical protein
MLTCAGGEQSGRPPWAVPAGRGGLPFSSVRVFRDQRDDQGGATPWQQGYGRPALQPNPCPRPKSWWRRADIAGIVPSGYPLPDRAQRMKLCWPEPEPVAGTLTVLPSPPRAQRCREMETQPLNRPLRMTEPMALPREDASSGSRASRGGAEAARPACRRIARRVR